MHFVLIDIAHVHECFICPVGSQGDSTCDSWSGTNWTDSFCHSIVQQDVSNHDDTVHKFLDTVSLWIEILPARSIWPSRVLQNNSSPTCTVTCYFRHSAMLVLVSLRITSLLSSSTLSSFPHFSLPLLLTLPPSHHHSWHTALRTMGVQEFNLTRKYLLKCLSHWKTVDLSTPL